MPTTQSAATFAPGPEPKQVTFFLDANKRVSNLAGNDVYAQIMYMKFDGLSNVAIAQALGVSIDVVSEQVRLYQYQLQCIMGNAWQPRRRNPRKTRRASDLLAPQPVPKKIF